MAESSKKADQIARYTGHLQVSGSGKATEENVKAALEKARAEKAAQERNPKK